jgi:hypothetical protein
MAERIAFIITLNALTGSRFTFLLWSSTSNKFCYPVCCLEKRWHFPTWRRFYLDLLNTWRLARDDFIGVISRSTRDAVLKYYPWSAERPLMLLPTPSFQSRLGQTPSCNTSGAKDRARLLVMSRGREGQLS